MTRIIISIDWDHTLRKTQGLDLNFLILLLYAQGNQIVKGLTTHRDLENTTLYALGSRQPEDALAATISYWQKHFFTALNIQLDFINARYQPLFKNENYYETTLLAFESKLADEIITHKIYENPTLLNSRIHEYLSKKETDIEHNRYKESQVSWICDQYNPLGQESLTVIHFDDDQDVIQQLPSKFPERYPHASKINLQTISIGNEFLLHNQDYLSLLNEIGLVDFAKNLTHIPSVSTLNPQSVISACLLQAQLHHTDVTLLAKLKEILEELESTIRTELAYCHQFAKRFIAVVTSQNRPIHLLSNDLKHFIVY